MASIWPLAAGGGGFRARVLLTASRQHLKLNLYQEGAITRRAEPGGGARIGQHSCSVTKINKPKKGLLAMHHFTIRSVYT